MNTKNYATLAQSKRLAELGFPQDKTDCVWVNIGTSCWILVPRTQWENESGFGKLEWYAAPNAQEVGLTINHKDSNLESDGIDILKPNPNFPMEESEYICIGEICNAQARTDALIWELEQAKK